MAEIMVDEGLDYRAGVFPKNGANLATLYLGLFTSQDETTVPARGATGGAAPAGWTEAAGTAYARQALAAATWGALSTNGNGRKFTYPEVTFPTVGAGGWGTVNGFFIATKVSSQAGDVLIFFSNFDDLTANPLNENDIQKVTPSWQDDG